MTYFLMYAGEDGTGIETFADKEKLLERIIDEPYFGADGPVEFLDHIPDFKYVSGNKVVIIKGDIVIPQPEKVVSTFTIE